MKATTAEVQFLLLLMAMACSKLHTCSSASGDETDRLSLLDFKNAITLDPQQALASWNDSTHFCSWEGVLCTTNTLRRVISIRLEKQGLVGQISPSLGNLTFLRNLSLATNRFTGEIPPSLGHLQYLQFLHLSNNTLQGRIPSFTNCSSLRVLWLHRNSFVGQFPSELPSGLHQLQISVNNLSGTIPASLSNITTLSLISCAYNNFVGNIPDEFAKLSNMQQLYMGANQLSGRFPHAIMNLSALTDLSLGLNELKGQVPLDLGSALRNLLLLELPVNFFHGHIPPSLTNASNLYYIEISRNNFSGVVPSTIGRLNKLEMLNLEYNQLLAEKKQDWEFLESLANCTELIDFSMTGNRLQGQVPASVGNLTNQLQYLYMAENQLSGEFLPGIANLRNLFIVSLAMNRFSGVLPEWLGTVQNLQKVSLGSNFFNGTIPSSLSNLSQLGELYLDSNQLVGQIPTSFGSLPILQVLNVSNNSLQGSIPKVQNSNNCADGTIHPDIGNAKQLTYLQLQSNKFSGEIPSTLGKLSGESLEDIELDRNSLSGSIPVSLGNIRNLKGLNFSHNNISGSIPVSLGNLQLLQQLDLSFNNLNGDVPTKGIFKNATAVRIDGNKDICGGPSELHLPSCPVIPLDSSKHKPSVLLKIMIPVAIAASLTVVISVLLLFRRRKQITQSIPVPLFGREIPKISYSDLFRATEGFATSNLIGQGRYGSVYQGTLFQDGNVVAIKCNALRNVRHRNLVPILTVCSTIDSDGNDFKALVYEFMPRGDLHNLLYSTRDSEGSSYVNYISLAQRLSIVVDVADALAYLHHSHHGIIVHCDIKPSNILLDNDMVAHVGDFGLARFKFDSTASSFADSNSISVAIKGTIGYVAPECAGGGQVSTASDVYSFGVVLLEVFIRRRPTDEMFKDGMSIAKFTEINFPNNVWQIVEPLLLQDLDLSKETPTAIKNSEAQILQSAGRCTLLHEDFPQRAHQHAGGGSQAARDQGWVTKRKLKEQFSSLCLNV
ncbi:hypothetical protein EJB05_29144, partial [Eragrostis curvula]